MDHTLFPLRRPNISEASSRYKQSADAHLLLFPVEEAYHLTSASHQLQTRFGFVDGGNLQLIDSNISVY